MFKDLNHNYDNMSERKKEIKRRKRQRKEREKEDRERKKVFICSISFLHTHCTYRVQKIYLSSFNVKGER